MRLRHAILAGGTLVLIVLAAPGVADPEAPRVASKGDSVQTTVPIPLSRVEYEPHERRAHDPWMPRPTTPPLGVITRSGPVVRGRFESIQVNVDEFGNNIPGDAANEPSIAIDPNDPNRIVIGWRQFDSVNSSFRQAGYAYSHDGGATWTFPGSLTPGVFGSDPVLDVDANGVFHYLSINYDEMRLFRSFDGGVTWDPPITVFPYFLDKPWMVIDRTGGPGQGNIYVDWSSSIGVDVGNFSRSTDGASSFLEPVFMPGYIMWGTLAVGPTGILYAAGGGDVVRSSNAWNADQTPEFEFLAGEQLASAVTTTTQKPANESGPNPGGLLWQAWVATDHQQGTDCGNVYYAGTFDNSVNYLGLYVTRGFGPDLSSRAPGRVDDDRSGRFAWRWFVTMSVAPNGRIDMVWNDTRNSGKGNLSETYYAWSYDGGATWSPNAPIGPMWNSWIGWPNQSKIGDYYDMVSDNEGGKLAYATTYNGEQDVYFALLKPDCDGDGTADADAIRAGLSEDGNGNLIPDDCEVDFDGDKNLDTCDNDIDNDGVWNADDRCLRTAPGYPVATDGTRLIDTNADCAVDLVDFGRLRNCLVSGGPGIDPGRCADFFDADLDGDTDLSDLASFFRAFEGTTGKD